MFSYSKVYFFLWTTLRLGAKSYCIQETLISFCQNHNIFAKNRLSISLNQWITYSNANG